MANALSYPNGRGTVAYRGGGRLISLLLCTQYQGNKGINSNCCSPNSIPAIIICLLTMMAAVITVLAEDPAAGHLVITLKKDVLRLFSPHPGY